MQLRWSALIALWTMLSGPIFSEHTLFPASSRVPASPAMSSVPFSSVSPRSKSFLPAPAASPARMVPATR